MAFFLIVFHIKNSYTDLPHPENVIQAICYYSGIGWWIRGFLSECPHNYWYEWYIPTLLVLYAVFPFLYKKSVKRLCFLTLLWFIIGCLLVVVPILSNHFGYQNVVFNSISQLHWSYQRVPIFILGIILFKYNQNYQDESNEMDLRNDKVTKIMDLFNGGGI